MQLVQACLCARKYLESSFHHCVAPVKLVQACLGAGTVWHRRFNRRRGAEMHVQACLSAWKDLESSFHHCWGPEMSGKEVLQQYRSCEASASLFKWG